MKTNLEQLRVRPVAKAEEPRYRELMGQHHYLGDLAKIGHTLWYVATFGDEWVALVTFSASALKCGVRDRWIGWDFRHQYGRLLLVANNSRFLILPDWHQPNLGSKVLSLCQKRICRDWLAHFGQALLLLETFVDPARFHGTVYRAANWACLGQTKGFRRIRGGYGAGDGSPKLVFVRPLRRDARSQLSRPLLEPAYQAETPKVMLSARHMRALPGFFKDIEDPRRGQGLRHRLPVVLAIAAGAVLCGMRGYKAMAGWAEGLGQDARERFGCRYLGTKGSRGGKSDAGKVYYVPSQSIIRDVLTRVDPAALDCALQRWNEAFGREDQSLVIDPMAMLSTALPRMQPALADALRSPPARQEAS
jgi:hypothetical protein